MPKPLALITGASSGIGAATARLLAQSGYRTVLVARSQDRLDAVIRELPESRAFALDAGDGDAVARMAADVRRTLGVPDVIVNAAGLGAWKRLEETTPEEAREMMNAPYFAAFNVTQAFMADWRSRRSGVVIHIGSPASLTPWPASVGYAAARWALRGFHQALRADLHGTGIHSCHVVFGRVDSAYFETNENALVRLPRAGSLIPTLTPEQCAAVILRTIRRPRAEVFHPFMLKVNRAIFEVFPGLTRWMLRKTGYRPD